MKVPVPLSDFPGVGLNPAEENEVHFGLEETELFLSPRVAWARQQKFAEGPLWVPQPHEGQVKAMQGQVESFS